MLDRVQVGVAGRKATRGFARSLSVALRAPAAYDVRGCCYDGVSGEWVGPSYSSADGSLTGSSTIRWSVGFVRSRHSLASVARSALWRSWAEVAHGSSRVRHVVAGRDVGTLPAFWVVRGEAPPRARHQAALALSLGRRLDATAVFHLAEPWADETAGGSAVTVAGKSPSAWNRSQADAALARVYVEGNLPPARVRIGKSGRRVSGKVRDTFGDPLAVVRVRLQRRVHHHWRTVRTRRTDDRGRYRVRAPRHGGRYRVAAELAGTTARSKTVRIRIRH